ncbi:MAG: hypothetical protein Q9159_001885 [Coniocarpon cinnabarinum]
MSTSLTIDPTAHIADKAQLHTSTSAPHPIIINARCVIHPFARLDSSNGPIALGQRCVIWEKVCIGTPRTLSSRPSSSAEQPRDDEDDGERETVRTITIGDGTIIQAHAQIPGPATIGAGCNIGIAAEIGPGVVLGERVTVASGTRVAEGAVIEKGCTVWGEGQMRKPDLAVTEEAQRDMHDATRLKEDGEERHRVLLTQLVKGTSGGTRFTG